MPRSTANSSQQFAAVGAEDFQQLLFAGGHRAEGTGKHGLPLDQFVQELVVNRQVGSLGANLLVRHPRHDGGDPVRIDGLDCPAFDPRHRHVEAVLGVGDSVEIDAGFNGADGAHVSSLHKGVLAATGVAAPLPCHDDMLCNSRVVVLRRVWGQGHTFNVTVLGKNRQQSTADKTFDLPLVVVVVAVQIDAVAAGQTIQFHRRTPCDLVVMARPFLRRTLLVRIPARSTGRRAGSGNGYDRARAARSQGRGS